MGQPLQRLHNLLPLGRQRQAASQRRMEALGLLQQALGDGNAQFRDGQWEAIEGLTYERSRLLIVQRTGWGKSIVYFLTTRLLRDQGLGATLLISPLLSLMRNQILAANRLGMRAATINSSNVGEWDAVRDQLRNDEIDVLLISPERLANEEFREQVLRGVAEHIGFFVVDEAHCISDWGHDFRPDYRRIARVLQLLPRSIPVLATTATANNRVVEDIQSVLGSKVQVMRGPLGRESLSLQTIDMPDQAKRMAWLAEKLPELPGSGIIYTLTIRDAQRVAGWLLSQGIEARAYWGGRDPAQREELEQRLLENRVKALVATSALGMGFDKPDLGFVIHFQRPASLVHYYQQVGRAGRALREAYGILLGGAEDREICDYFISTALPPEAQVAEVMAALKGTDGLSVASLEREANLSRSQIDKVLVSLAVRSPAPVSKRDSRWHLNPVPYVYEREKIEKLTKIRREEQQRMTQYMQSRTCLMQFLQRELDDPATEPCGHCAVCSGRALIGNEVPQSLIQVAAGFLKRNSEGIEPRRLFPRRALSLHGWEGSIPVGMQAAVGKALCIWGDAGWGDLVRIGKQNLGRFKPQLVSASAALITNDWKPSPFPKWVTCVPSLNHPRLVPEFAGALAASMGLPFVPCIQKTRETMPQKVMENSYRQAHNLENAFVVEGWAGMEEPVLLVDDMVDSGWTFTVTSALLREAGSGPVFPFALAVTSKHG